jgi:C4-type Zn-finger protein
MEVIYMENNNNYTCKTGYCPVCNKLTLEYSKQPYFNGNNCYFEWHCKECGTEGKEVNYIEFIGHEFYDEKKEEYIELYEA